MRQGTEEADAAAGNQWVIREFDLVESLICQLELMTPSARRRALISLQYALLGGDAEGSGQTDGFGLVSALIGAGFQLQRLNRVHLLKCVEEMGQDRVRRPVPDSAEVVQRLDQGGERARAQDHQGDGRDDSRETHLARAGQGCLAHGCDEYNEKLKVEAARREEGARKRVLAPPPWALPRTRMRFSRNWSRCRYPSSVLAAFYAIMG